MEKMGFIVASGLAFLAATAGAETINGVNFNFVTIGNAGNAADITGYGAVNYNYRIADKEISYSQFIASAISIGDPVNYWQGKLVSDDAPVVQITWHQAAQYCNWLTSGNVNNGAYVVSGGLITAIDRAGALTSFGKVYVLPTEDEWYKAAYYTGSGYSLYANGTSTAPIHNTDANFNTAGGYLDGPAWTVVSGTAEQNGTYNMMGNVWEWLESAEDGTYNSVSDLMSFRGGDYFQGVGKLAKTERGSAEQATMAFYNTGMRVVEIIPEPGTMSLMGLSTVGVFLTRTMRRRKRAGQTLMPVRIEHRCDAFCTEAEFWAAREAATPVETDLLSEVVLVTKDRAGRAWSHLRACCAELDKAFWNRMVVRHERRLARRKAFRAALRKKVLDGFDAFLAAIMK